MFQRIFGETSRYNPGTMRALNIRGTFESPEAAYGRYNFQRRSWLDRAGKLLMGRGPRVLVLAGDEAIGRSYFCDALKLWLAREHGEELAVWHLDLEGFEPDGEDSLGR